MDNKPRNRYSVIALIVSLASLIVALVAGVLKILIGLGSFTPSNPETYNLVLQVGIALVAIGLAVYSILEPDSVRKFLSGRQARYGSNAVVMILAFVGIIIVANYLMVTNPTFQGMKADLTENKVNTLSPEMIRAMETLPGKLTATGFFSQAPTDTARQLFEDMRAKSNGKFEYSFIDPVRNPVAAKEAGITGDGKILLEMNGQKEIAAYADEAEILTAMNRILNPEQRTVYFLTGHGEHDINGTDQSAMSRARTTLENKNFTVKTLNLLAENVIPADAKAIIIAGPAKPISANESSLLINYALHGGALVVMEDPAPLTSFGDSPDPLADSLDNVWGLRLRNDFVVDTNNSGSEVNAIGAVFDPSHPITHTMSQVTIMPLTRSIEVRTVSGFTLTSLVQTSPNAQTWGETDFAPLEGSSTPIGLDPATDTPGPVTLMASSEKQDGGRVVIIGNSGFATDAGFDAYGNGDLFVNSVAWAAGQGKALDVTPKDVTQRTYTAPNQIGWLAILFGSICLIPGLVLAAGIYAWASRRRRG